ncbi:MAG: hypothetical protein IJ864_05420 [Alphaproteobacteria bacterium]|nr:hypothetical protein [Alphaproteobacteria bacterium]
MKKNICLSLLFSLVLLAKPAHAIIEFPSIAISAQELKDVIVMQVEELIRKKVMTNSTLKNGFGIAASCFKNPANCNLSNLTSLMQNGITRINKFAVMPGVPALASGDITKIGSETLEQAIKDGYVYTQGKESLKRVRENRDNVNSVIANDASTLFAKGATTKLSIQQEDSTELYPDPSNKNNMEEILYVHNRAGLLTESRLAHILELRAYMVGGQATAELTTQSTKPEDNKDGN